MKITLYDNKIVFTSDLHLNHRKLCTGYEDRFDRTRKYVTVDEMNADIEKQWNNVVDDETTVFFLGDFTLGTPGSKLVDLFREYYNKLHFKHMYWLRGNHDYDIFKKLSKVIEEFPKVTLVRDNHILLTHNGVNYLLQHYSYNDINDTDYKDADPSALNYYDSEGTFITYLVHGHTHEFEQTTKCSHKGAELVQNNVNWESYYRPVRIHELQPKDDGKTLVIIRGIPGSGKSTFAKKLLADLRSQGHKVSHFETDNFWINEAGEYKFNPALLGVAHSKCFNDVFDALKGEDSFVIVSNTFVKHKELKPYLNEAAAHGYNVSVYRMANDFGSIHNVPAETINSMKEHFADFEGETIVRADN